MVVRDGVSWLATLAADPGGSGSLTRVMVWLGVLIVVTIVGGLVAMAVRRRLLGPDSRTDPRVGMLDELQRMRDRGEMTEDEYERTRRAIAERAAGKRSERPPGTQSGPGGSPPDPGDRPGEADLR